MFDPARYEESRKDAFAAQLDALNNESDFQDFLELYTIHLPTFSLLNHDVLFGSVFSKVHLHLNRCITDFTYVTRSSDEIRICHIELEDPKKRIFRVTNNLLGFDPEFTDAINQVRHWKTHLNDTNQDTSVFETPFGRWIAERRLTRSYNLIYGRSREIDNPQKRRLWHQIQEETGLIIKTADQTFESGFQRRNCELNVLGRVQDRFKFKYLHVEPIQIFSALGRDDFSLEPHEIDKLRAWGYSIDDWLNGMRLSVGSGKYSSPERQMEHLGDKPAGQLG